MSSRHHYTHSLLKLPLKALVKGSAIPANPVDDLAIDVNKPIVYALPFRSNVDLLTLRHYARNAGLPDPLEPLIINGESFERFVYNTSRPNKRRRYTDIPTASVELFEKLLKQHKSDTELDVQVIPVTVLWGRSPGKEGQCKPYLRAYSSLQKAKMVIAHGRDCLVRFSPVVSLRYMADHHGTDVTIAHKLARVARIHFSRQKLAASGPDLPVRHQLFARLMASPVIQKAIADEAKSKQISEEKARQEAHKILDEIAANFSYSLVKKGDRFLGWLWNRIYQGLNVNNASTVRRLAQDGHEVVYLPCHRSHMDYLLLSYVLFHEGMVPPHIAAGINLNFFPAGPLFRRGGAFFIRRSFKGNKLYSTLFREYLAELFAKGYSVEYFSEGGRSRTGRLLPAKTGMLAMTIQAMLRGLNRPVTLVPVYIGYEHVMEVNSYAKELKGNRKEKENAGLVLRTIRKLRNFGQGYVNFGEPITINQYLNDKVPTWTQDIDPLGNTKPQWMTPVVNDLATQVMTRINDAAAANAMTLCATALLASRQRALSRNSLIKQVDCYLKLLTNVPYSATMTVPKQSAEELVAHAESLDKFIIETDKMGDIISLDRQQSILMTYYRNNIIHLLAMPSLIAQIVVRHQSIHKDDIIKHATTIYPFLKQELFITHDINDIPSLVERYLHEFAEQQLIVMDNERVTMKQNNAQRTMRLGRIIAETLQRYAIALNLLVIHSELNKAELEKHSQAIAQRLGRLHGINAPEFFDKGVFSALFVTLKQQGFIDENGQRQLEQCQAFTEQLNVMITPEVRLTIQESVYRATPALA